MQSVWTVGFFMLQLGYCEVGGRAVLVHWHYTCTLSFLGLKTATNTASFYFWQPLFFSRPCVHCAVSCRKHIGPSSSTTVRTRYLRSDLHSVLAHPGGRGGEIVREITRESSVGVSGVLAALQRVQAEVGAIGTVCRLVAHAAGGEKREYEYNALLPRRC